MNGNKTIGATFTQLQRGLTVNVVGSGTVAKNPDKVEYNHGEVVQLTVTPAEGWTFSGWSGDLTGSANPASITMDANKSVTATFVEITYSLAVSKTGTGGGVVTSNPAGIDCGADCSKDYDQATPVILTATATPGSFLAGWIGCSRANGSTCEVVMDQDRNVEAMFSEIVVGGFNDVASGHWADDYIYALSQAGITGGCGGGDFCPDDPVTRGMMAVFVIASRDETPSQEPYNVYFSDIADDTFAPFINTMCELGITGGCGDGIFCPNGTVTRAQMAVFIITSMEETLSQAPYNAYFSDIADDNFAPFINRMNELGITGGCGGGMYCPTQPVTRAQMAVFLSKGFLGM
jgi:uncharacterized repeat protein (TIGR02543 family)